MNRLPTLFVSHGSPTLAIDPGSTGPQLAEIGRRLPRPRAVLVVSPHWLTAIPTVGASPKPPTIHDFGGFPPALYELDYPAPGAPELAADVQRLLQTAGVPTASHPTRGLDHGAWVPLRFLYPRADVPVVQLSVQPHVPPERQLALGRALAPLTREGVLILASGSFTHNLYEVHWDAPEGEVEAYVEEFRSWMIARLLDSDLDALADYRARAPHALRAHPTDEHLLPLFVALGAADGAGAARLHDAVTFGTLAMDAFAFGHGAEMLKAA